MFRFPRIVKAIELIRSIAAMMDMSADPATIKAAILKVLKALQIAASQTPTVWDDMALSAAIWAIENLWDLVADKLWPNPMSTVSSTDDADPLVEAIARQFPPLTLAD